MLLENTIHTQQGSNDINLPGLSLDPLLTVTLTMTRASIGFESSEKACILLASLLGNK